MDAFDEGVTTVEALDIVIEATRAWYARAASETAGAAEEQRRKVPTLD
jgi:hypothetical protein